MNELEKIIEKLKSGDKKAIAEWCDFFDEDVRGRTYWLVKQAPDPINQDDDDACQEAYLRLLELANEIIVDPNNDTWTKDPKKYVMGCVHWHVYNS